MDTILRGREDCAPRCRCAECRAGDALPDRLQGWPGAYQIPLFHLHTARRIASVMPPRSLDDWDYPRIRQACADRCALHGDPPCHELHATAVTAVNGEGVKPIGPCGECWRDVGVEPGDEFDEAAAVGRLV